MNKARTFDQVSAERMKAEPETPATQQISNDRLPLPHSSPYRRAFARLPHGITWTNSVSRWFQEAYHYTTGQYKYFTIKDLSNKSSPHFPTLCGVTEYRRRAVEGKQIRERMAWMEVAA